ncbi:hypothetical protein amrb99_14150 [Actinomadura sp. RB99]|nr:hypothetical protein [Actinomadura sp. RB99]
MAVMAGAVAKASLRVAMMLEPRVVSHHSMRSRWVSFFNVGRPAGVMAGVWSGRESRSGWRMTTDRIRSWTPTAQPAAGLSANAVFTASHTAASSLASSACHQCAASAVSCW